MNTLVIWSDPRADGFARAVFDAAVDGARRAGRDVRTIDLYRSGYDPRMGEEEWRAYRAHQPLLDDVTAGHVEDLRWARELVFVYPTWWAGLPAVLKGWLERTMVPGVAFELDRSGRLQGTLDGIDRVVGVTMYQDPAWVVHLTGDAGRRTLSRTLRLTCSKPWWVRACWVPLYRADQATPAQQAAFVAKVGATLGRSGTGTAELGVATAPGGG